MTLFLFWTNDGRHAMIFKDFEGNLRTAFHIRNTNKGNEEPVIDYFNDDNGTLPISTSLKSQ